eukprot:TRINITY_DN1842_c0_g1_i5.p1 TRINITY_DN1842_c0_g1~~TRINITY_DN1842_c0_g1_i5.p1  ORF type:complete len:121 (-),score=2.78 TRINITY_DN1842_c0_g1_i5:739-1101(-)
MCMRRGQDTALCSADLVPSLLSRHYCCCRRSLSPAEPGLECGGVRLQPQKPRRGRKCWPRRVPPPCMAYSASELVLAGILCSRWLPAGQMLCQSALTQNLTHSQLTGAVLLAASEKESAE